MLGLVLDEPTDNDSVADVDGLRFVLEAKLADELQRFLPLTIDFQESWYGVRVRPGRASSC